MGRQINRLSVRKVQTLSKPGRHSDGGGLYLVVSKAGAKRWAFLFRCRQTGRLREMGLGGILSVTLAKARQKAADARAMLAEGQDPIDERKAGKASNHIPTFGAFAEDVIASLESGWRNAKHKAQWRSTLRTHAAALQGKRVDAITTDDVLDVLQPIWTVKAETASRVRGRIEKILDAAKAKGLRSGENPARWRGHLDSFLAKRQKLQRGHHPAMPWEEVPAFMARLRQLNTTGSRALEFVILTASRSGEVLRSVRDGQIHGAGWDEIDRSACVWQVPAIRMKAGRPHRVPLSDQALAILDDMEKIRRGPFIFPGQRSDQPLSEMALDLVLRRMKAKPYTVHGFRSSFRDWVGEHAIFPGEVAEAALAHVVGDQTERAYRRGDALERRRELMEAWAKYCEPANA